MNKLTIKNLTPDLKKLVQLVAFEYGFTWAGDKNPELQYLNKTDYCFYSSGKQIRYNSTPEGTGDELFLDAQTDFNKIIKWFQSSKTISVTLNGGHVAEFVNGKIKVGCQTFEIDIIDKLILAREEYKKLTF